MQRYGIYGMGDSKGKDWFIYDRQKGGLAWPTEMFKTKREAKQRASEMNTPEDEKSNAKLIAAAPDLLEALKNLFENCAMIHKHWGDNCNSAATNAAIEAAKQAIKKATE